MTVLTKNTDLSMQAFYRQLSDGFFLPEIILFTADREFFPPGEWAARQMLLKMATQSLTIY